MSFAVPPSDYVVKSYIGDLGTSNSVDIVLEDQPPQDRLIMLTGYAASASTPLGTGASYEIRLYGGLSSSQLANFAVGGAGTVASPYVGVNDVSYVVLGWLSPRPSSTSGRGSYVWQQAAPVLGRNLTRTMTLVVWNMGTNTIDAGTSTGIRVQLHLRTGGALGDATYTI